MDTYSFGESYTKKFGLFCTDFHSETKQKYLRIRSYLYQKIVDYRGLGNDYIMEQLKDLEITEQLQQTFSTARTFLDLG